MAFTKKLITVQFEMANGQFEGGGNTARVSGLRVSCLIVNAGQGSGQAEISIWGLPLSMMNQLSTVGSQFKKMYQNKIAVLAGDAEGGQSIVWTGSIVYAYVDAQGMPDVVFRVSSLPAPYYAVKPIPPTSIKGSADAAQMMERLAGQMEMSFENAGVDVKLSNPYYPGTAWTQAQQIAKHGNFNMGIDRGTMVIVARGKARQGETVLISPQTGMIGYPLFEQAYIIVTALYDPAVKYQGLVEVKSDLTPANGTWKVNRLEYQLESQVPHGRWNMVIEGVLQDAEAPA